MSFFSKVQGLAKAASGGQEGAGGFTEVTQFASTFISSEAAPAAAPDAASPPGAPAAAPGADPSYQELLSSAQVVFAAASKKGEGVDYGQLAGAASDLLDGVSAKTSLDEGAYGTYITQAKRYLSSYETSHTAAAPAPEAAAPPPAPEAAAPPPAPEAAAPPPEAAPAAPAPEAHAPAPEGHEPQP